MKMNGRPVDFDAPEDDWPETRPDPIDHIVDQLTRLVRLLAWTAMLVLCCAILWLLGGNVSWAGDPASAAREIGRAGTAAAGAVARDASNAANVPGFAGTDIPERRLTADGLEDAARQALADPDHPGGRAGRALIEGAASRPEAEVPASNPVVRRSERIGDDPEDVRWQAGGLASGRGEDCTAETGNIGRGGSCGRIVSCVGADCETVETESNTGFARSAATLNMVLDMGGDGFDRGDLRFFAGERKACRIRWGGLADCCKNSGLLIGISGCTPQEYELAKERHLGNTHYLGTRCAKRVFGFCIRRERVWCVFGSKLGRILHEQARPQLGIGWGSCRGFTVAEVETIDFDDVDLTEFTENFIDGSMEPSLSLPGKGDTQALMRKRIGDFYRRDE